MRKEGKGDARETREKGRRRREERERRRKRMRESERERARTMESRRRHRRSRPVPPATINHHHRSEHHRRSHPSPSELPINRRKLTPVRIESAHQSLAQQAIESSPKYISLLIVEC
ncbi:unnamed protein product [Microthlaspi erraticum]|uniref:Uncharacterized protein n=1 Tax=Microthlaspi erraticum TaxID=1685480 RepID=A0A6D2LIH0_9BRAS|nr:unnamed protein product [Microthlaspi erraticum]